MIDLEREHLKKKSEKELLDDIFSNKSEESGTYDFPDRYGKHIEEETAADDTIIDFSEDDGKEILKKEEKEERRKEKEDTETENTKKEKETEKQEKHSTEAEDQADKEKEEKEEKEKDKAVVFIDFSEKPDGKGEEQEKDSEELLDYEHTERDEKDEDEKKRTDKKIPWWVYLLVALGIVAAALIILLVI